ncbi:hypothetical protein M422DRAFT_35523 [Sphaerobolus stellatus SS14]|uniref:Beta-lactamase-related domain-containing protein n=1 Tax=Sphaerobolus stellatus (strain SS14) TaxID=990650 RepID=A0A0C9V7Q7_SPHS4|nr:hypothetical protein M422DRAFT_35523 [Sphaerobolus stellatus SS14]
MFGSLGLLLFLLFNPLIAAHEGIQAPFQIHDNSHRRLKPVLDEEFEQWLNEKGSKWGMKGVAIAVTRRTKDINDNWDGWETELKGYGVADRWGNPVDEETLFSIGSNSKLFTALAIGLLVEDEKYPINWDTKVKDLLPKAEWKLQDNIAEQNANLIDILSHRTGLPRHDHSYSRTDTVRSLVSKLRYLKPSAEFREIWQYNNQMYTTANHIVELLTNQTFTEFVTEKIIKPLGMNSSTYLFYEAIQSHILADGFLGIKTEDQTITYKAIPFYDKMGNTSVGSGPGGVISNVEDLTTWLQTLILNGRHPITNDSIIPSAAIAKTAEGVSLAAPFPLDPSVSPEAYGLGQASYSYQGHYIVEHSGGTVGHYTVISRAPFDGIGIAILTNAYPPGGSPLMELVKWRLYEKALGLKHVDWDSKYSTRSSNKSSTVKKPSTVQTTLPLSSYTGIYFNPAYGTVILCPYRNSSSIQSQQHRDHCQSTVSEISQTLPGRHPEFVFAWDKYWSTHVIVSHSDGDRFAGRSFILFPPPFPNSKDEEDNKPFAVDFGELDAGMKFVVEKGPDGKDKVVGIALKDVWGSGNGGEILKGEDRESTEVWFDCVGEL